MGTACHAAHVISCTQDVTKLGRVGQSACELGTACDQQQQLLVVSFCYNQCRGSFLTFSPGKMHGTRRAAAGPVACAAGGGANKASRAL